MALPVGVSQQLVHPIATGITDILLIFAGFASVLFHARKPADVISASLVPFSDSVLPYLIVGTGARALTEFSNHGKMIDRPAKIKGAKANTKAPPLPFTVAFAP